MYRAVKITRGASGWGGPLVVKADEKTNKILCVTGNEVSPIAAKLAQMTGCELVDGFSTGCPDDEVLVAVVDCGGTARCGVVNKFFAAGRETIDGIGGYTTHGSICTAEEANEKGYVPFGLVTNKAVMKQDVKKGTLITYDMIDLDKTTLIYKLRKEQDAMYGRYVL